MDLIVKTTRWDSEDLRISVSTALQKSRMPLVLKFDLDYNTELQAYKSKKDLIENYQKALTDFFNKPITVRQVEKGSLILVVDFPSIFTVDIMEQIASYGLLLDLPNHSATPKEAFLEEVFIPLEDPETGEQLKLGVSNYDQLETVVFGLKYGTFTRYLGPVTKEELRAEAAMRISSRQKLAEPSAKKELPSLDNLDKPDSLAFLDLHTLFYLSEFSEEALANPVTLLRCEHVIKSGIREGKLNSETPSHTKELMIRSLAPSLRKLPLS
eukprot:TRINITY_DN19954_c0_g1_i1.p1 TRINITY_DN19954_c0_g1~~TRINITY_DN19954_c0_g1_i1.p1  ORF type:complete len:288 (-),score=55.88 TRINITY_DN19954_c0_g1_i1:178-984(-)